MKLSKIKRKFARRISVSRIAEQLWCEKKLELKLMYGIDIKSRAMIEGSRRHEQVATRDKLPEPENFIDWLGMQVYLTDLSLSAFHNRGFAREVFLVSSLSQEEWERKWYIAGSVDEIRLSEGRAQIVERKTRKSESIPLAMNHMLQGMLYHKMLDVLREQDYCKNVSVAYRLRNGDNISRNFAKKAGISNRNIIQICLNVASKLSKLPEPSENICLVYEKYSGELIGEVKVRFDERMLNRFLNFSRAYWMGEREAIPAKEKWKCKSCEVRNLCSP